MKVLLGMLTRANPADEPFQEAALSVMASSFDGVKTLDDGGKPVSDFSAQRNRLIDFGEREGYDWMFMIDADECMFPEDIATVRSMMTKRRRLIILPRIDFAKDFDHVDPTPYPDYQARVFRLGAGYRFRKPVHEGLFRRFSPASDKRLGLGTISDSTPIYHYGRLRTREQIELKAYNYQQLMQGASPVDVRPEGWVENPTGEYWAQLKPFDDPHPLRGLVAWPPG